MTNAINEQLVLISGESATGKSASLLNIRDQDQWAYLNCEAGKRLPFRNQFQSVTVTDPWQVHEYFEDLRGEEGCKGIIIDTATFMMDMFESQYVLPSSDTQKAWGQYAQFWKTLMQTHVAGFGKPVIIMGHTQSAYDEKAMRFNTRLAIKGAIGKNNGAEAYFSTVVSTKKVELKDLEGMDKSLLTISPQDEALGYKHVFQTQLTKDTIGERIRSPMGMFEMNQTYMDNDAQRLLDHLHQFYEGVPA